ncbi:hypothetical protein CAPTEDRAFT_212413 [Capitella teleta]|uniref:Uncharacterized protein n=1 Tax=Capitella teleta TaxID=283909 RepID=R7U3F6_CAPTE|nr:hypothetical protein CAPTEDRAFT_212413 [Capitella teleta]|eukprot:ELT98206.1 hypothetical protein CAPTEDRAFT_212413 [Capitella teleta]
MTSCIRLQYTQQDTDTASFHESIMSSAYKRTILSMDKKASGSVRDLLACFEEGAKLKENHGKTHGPNHNVFSFTLPTRSSTERPKLKPFRDSWGNGPPSSHIEYTAPTPSPTFVCFVAPKNEAVQGNCERNTGVFDGITSENTGDVPCSESLVPSCREEEPDADQSMKVKVSTNETVQEGIALVESESKMKEDSKTSEDLESGNNWPLKDDGSHQSNPEDAFHDNRDSAGYEDQKDSGLDMNMLMRGYTWSEGAYNDDFDEENNTVRLEVGGEEQPPVVSGVWAVSDLGSAISHLTRELGELKKQGSALNKQLQYMHHLVQDISSSLHQSRSEPFWSTLPSPAAKSKQSTMDAFVLIFLLVMQYNWRSCGAGRE